MIPLPKLLNNTGAEIGRISPILASVTLNIVPLSSATLQLKPGDIIAPRALVEMFTINGSAGIFRARAPQYGYGDILTTVELEHSISMLGDYLIKSDIEQSMSASAAISRAFSYYLGGAWVLGTNEASETVVLTANYDTVLDTILSIMEQIPDYMLTFDQSSFPWVLNVVHRPNQVDAEGRLSRNISSVQITYDDSELCTRVWADNMYQADAVGSMDANTINEYGIVERELSGYAGASPDVVQRAASLFLEKHKRPKMSVEISGIDLSDVTGEDIDKFSIGKLFRLAIPDENVTVTELITSMIFSDIYNAPHDIDITLAQKADTVVNFIHEQALSGAGSGGGGGGGGGGLQKEQEKLFKRFETFYEQTDEKFSWLATDSEWDELAQEGRVTAYSELVRTSHFVEDTVAQELPFDDWKPKWLIQHPEDAQLTDEQLREKYRTWVTTNPYAIYNTEYSDATRTERIISKTGINDLGENETVLSRITQEADRVESSVYASQSQVYSAIGQTASNIRVELADTEQNLYNYINMTASGIRQQITNSGNRTIVNDTDPRGATYTPKEGDIWIESVHDGTWDGADGFDWEHDEDYDWTQVQGAKAWVWKNDQWQLVADRQQLVTYSDFVNTADILISQKISELANEQGQVEVYRSLIEQSAENIRAEVYGATSDIYTYIHQTASSVSIAAGQRPTTVVQNSHTDGTPTSINGRGLKENDIWIDTADQTSWDAALDYNWNDDAGYNWNDLRSDKIYVYRNGAWQLAVDGTILAEDTDLQVERDRIALLARNIDTLDGYARENFAQVNVRANEIYSEVLDKTNNLGSSIAQTATQIRSEVHAANSQIYSEINQTASNILLHVENAVSDLGASIEVTAKEIRSDVWATQSTVYTSITQTASQIRSEVRNTKLDLQTSITQTASQIRSEVNAAKSSLYSSITQTASQIRSEVASTTSSLRSSIKQNANDIELKVSKGAISSTINQTAQSVLISASKINLEGYVTANELSAVSGDFEKLTSGTTTATALKAALLETTGNLNVKGTNYSGVTLKIGSVVSATVLSSSSAAMDFDHYHSISISESGGVITVKTGKASSSEGSANFNMSDTAYFNKAVSDARASSLSAITLRSSDTGTSTQTVTVYSDDDEEIDLDTTVDASAVYSSGYSSGKSDGISSVSALIVNGNNYTVSGRQYLSPGSSMTVYPATYVNGTMTRNSNAALVIIANTQTITVDGWGIAAAAGGGTKVNVNVNGQLYSHTFGNYP